jgi:glucose-1-phosphate thymidylyltransferase
MLAGIKEILIISNPEHIDDYKTMLGMCERLGLILKFKSQKNPNGIAEALLLSEDFLNGDHCALILGDNIFYGSSLGEMLRESSKISLGATIFGYTVSDPSRYGIASFNDSGLVTKIIEKPEKPETNIAVTGLYFYDERAVEFTKTLKPSKRNELEITDLNSLYLRDNSLKIKILGRGFAWLDAGTSDSLLDSSNFIATIQKRQGVIVSSPEEIALQNHWISTEDFLDLVISYPKNRYSSYLKSIVSN